MGDSQSSAALATSRRDFIKTAGMLGAGVLAVRETTAMANAAESTAAQSGNALVLPPPAGQKFTGKKVPLAPPDKQLPQLQVPQPVKRKLGFAIVGLGELALEEVMPAFAECKYAKPTALVSGHLDKARKVAEAYGIDANSIYNYETYDQLADHAEVDVIYIILPNSMHAEYTIRGFKAGKHVLCEKPMAMSVAECHAMIEAGRQANKQLMIAYRLHYEPYNLKVMDLCRQQTFGKIRTISSSHCQNVTAPNIRLSAGLGGGPLGDVGVYCLNATRYITNEEPVAVTAVAQQPTDDPRFREVPESIAFTLEFPSGAIAHCDCSFGTATSRRYRVHCEQGIIDMDPAFAYRGLELNTMQSQEDGTMVTNQLEFTSSSQFAAEMDHLAECILNNKPNHTPGEEGLADIRAIAAIHEAARTGTRVEVSGA